MDFGENAVESVREHLERLVVEASRADLIVDQDPHVVAVSTEKVRSGSDLRMWSLSIPRTGISLATRFAALVCGLACSNVRSGPPAPAPSLSARIDAIIGTAMTLQEIPGVTLLVEHRGRPIVARGYGYADVENQVPAQLDTVYQIASLTKQFTSAAILQLVEHGKLRLDDDVTKLLPKLRLRGGTVTVSQLLNHTSGIVEYNRDETIPMWGTAIDHDRFLALIDDRELEFKPGEKFQYRNSGYYLLGMIVEVTSGMSYGDYMRASIFLALGMRSTSQCTHRDIIPKRAHGYTIDAGKLRNPKFLDMSWTFAVGSLCSTATDLLLWDHGLRSGRVVSADSYKEMYTGTALADGTVTDYGFGLGYSLHDGHPVVRHGGNTVGFTTYLTHYPDDDLTIVLLTNNDEVVAWKIDDDIARVVLAMPPRRD
jgi:D-alanyl-D-alanine carboxypeptidase